MTTSPARRSLYGNFDIVLDHFSRIFKLDATAHAPCIVPSMLYVVPMRVCSLSHAVWRFHSDGGPDSRLRFLGAADRRKQRKAPPRQHCPPPHSQSLVTPGAPFPPRTHPSRWGMPHAPRLSYHDMTAPVPSISCGAEHRAQAGGANTYSFSVLLIEIPRLLLTSQLHRAAVTAHAEWWWWWW